MKTSPSFPLAACTAAAALLLPALAAAQAFPAKPIRIVIPFAPGGVSDGLVRILGPRLSEALGQPVVVDNRGGAGGNIAADIVVRSNPDGHTIFLGSTLLTTNGSLYRKLSYDPAADFAPVSHLATAPYLLMAHPSLGAGNAAELIALAKAKPEGLNYASSGIGSASHLAGELFRIRAGVKLSHIPYKGGALAAIAVSSGETPLFFGTVASSIAHVRSGRLKAIAVSGLKRSPFAPDVPTLAETALPGFDVTTWDGFVVPARTPPAAISRLHAETVKALAMPAVREAINNIGYEPTGTTPEQMAQFLRAETALWSKVIKDAGIRAD
jgi:tripartite-type tricarboxylate transporter receptor subunit TctC